MFWESRLESTERVKKEYRDNARKLCLENESLQNKLKHAEKDTLQVIAFLKAEDVKKEDQVRLDLTTIENNRKIYVLPVGTLNIIHCKLKSTGAFIVRQTLVNSIHQYFFIERIF